MIKPKIEDFLKDPNDAQKVAALILNRAHKPQPATLSNMRAEVAGKFDATHPEVYRMMLTEYARRIWKVELVDELKKG